MTRCTARFSGSSGNNGAAASLSPSSLSSRCLGAVTRDVFHPRTTAAQFDLQAIWNFSSFFLFLLPQPRFTCVEWWRIIGREAAMTCQATS